MVAFTVPHTLFITEEQIYYAPKIKTSRRKKGETGLDFLNCVMPKNGRRFREKIAGIVVSRFGMV